MLSFRLAIALQSYCQEDRRWEVVLISDLSADYHGDEIYM